MKMIRTATMAGMMLMAGASVSCFAQGAPAAIAAAPVDLAAAFGARPAIEHLSLSPDGSKVAYIAPAPGQGSALYTMETRQGAKEQVALVLDGDPERLSACHWVSNDRLACIVYGVVAAEDILPFTRMIAVNADGTNGQLLSTKQNYYSRGYQLGGGDVVDWLPDEDGAILMSRRYVPDDHLGSRAGSAREGLGVDHLDTRTLKVVRAEEPRKEAWEYISDGHGAVRIMGTVQYGAETGMAKAVTNYAYRLKGSKDWQKLGDYNRQTMDGFNPCAIDYERDAVYGFRKKDGRRALYRLALDGSGREELVFAQPDVDVDGLITIGRRNRVVGVSYATDVRHVVYFDPALQKLVASLRKALPNQPVIDIIDASQDESKLLIRAGNDNDPGVYYILDRSSHALAVFGLVRPQLENITLASVKPISYPAADGAMVPGYLTLPAGGTGKGLPAIVLPHGGPSARDEWGFDWLSQYFAARGFAVLQPNFRGSSGYGDAWFKDNGFKSWRTAINDVDDAGKWLVAQGIADPRKLAILGWSYGGYAALQSAVVDPGFFKAVVAIAPVTDLNALKEEHRFWSDFYLVEQQVGSGPHIREGSPAQNAGAIKVPVLIFHGELDRNVRIAESRLMDAKLKAAGVPHELVTWPRLDHYLDDSNARATMLRKSDAFLRASMGM